MAPRTDEGQEARKALHAGAAITAKLDGFLGKIQEPNRQAADASVAYDKTPPACCWGPRIWPTFAASWRCAMWTGWRMI